jgi:hypothetical protein
MRFSLNDVGADVWSHERTYSPLYYSGRMDLSPDVQLVCDRETLFSLVVL